jgi:acyl carrier protein
MKMVRQNLLPVKSCSKTGYFQFLPLGRHSGHPVTDGYIEELPVSSFDRAHPVPLNPHTFALSSVTEHILNLNLPCKISRYIGTHFTELNLNLNLNKKEKTMEEKTIFEKVAEILKPYVREPEDLKSATGDTDILNDLKVNSSRLVDIILAIEDEFDIEVSDDEADEVQTVGDAVKLITGKI